MQFSGLQCAEYRSHYIFTRGLHSTALLLGARQSLCTSLVSGFWRPQHAVCHTAVNVVHFLWRHAVWCSVQCTHSVQLHTCVYGMYMAWYFLIYTALAPVAAEHC